MPYTTCSSCGAKALVGATRCPRCQAPFVSYDIKGERVPTVNCPNCGVQRPVAIGVCPNCLMSNSPAGARLRGLILVGLAIAAITAVGYLMSRRVTSTSSVTQIASPDTQPTIDTTPTMVAPPVVAPSAARAVATVPSGTPAPAPVVMPPPGPPHPKATASLGAITMPVKPAKLPAVAVPDSGTWEYAIAITWVRVRSEPSRASEVLRMIDSAQRVRLGPPMYGWRAVRVGVDRGWVDPRLFVVQPEPRP